MEREERGNEGNEGAEGTEEGTGRGKSVGIEGPSTVRQAHRRQAQGAVPSMWGTDYSRKAGTAVSLRWMRWLRLMGWMRWLRWLGWLRWVRWDG
jgi:hypothetical protein